MPGEFRAIETKYDGRRFRSRPEARWAVFLNRLGVVFEYEAQGYVLSNGTPYLPDFWLPEFRCFLEIKGAEATEEEEERAYLLARDLDRDVYLFSGGQFQRPTALTHAAQHMVIEHYGTWGMRYDDRHMPGYAGGYYTFWQECLGCPGALPSEPPGFIGLHGSRHFEQHAASCIHRPVRTSSCSPRLLAAYEAALSARFEFGESG